MFVDSLRLFCSNCRLAVARMLAEGRRSRFFAPILIGAVLTGFVALVLYAVYHSFCLTGISSGYGADSYRPTDVFDAAYYLLFTNGGQNLYDGGHWIGIAITSVGIVFLAILTSFITNAFERVAQEYLDGERTYLFKSHIVIIGASDVLYSIIKHNPDARYLILTGRNVEEIRREVYAFLGDNVKRKNLVFFYGDRTSDKDIARLSLAWAKEVFVIGDSMESDSVESYRDAYNMDCVETISRYLSNHQRVDRLSCHVMFEYQTTFAAFQFSEMGESFKECIDFRPFNFYDMWAQQVLVAGHAGDAGKDGKFTFQYKFVDTVSDGEYINKDSVKTVHLIVVGMTKMGIALGLQAAQICHFPNFVENRNLRTRITFIDSDADIERDYLRGRFSDLARLSKHRFIDFSQVSAACMVPWSNEDSWLDIEWEFIKGRVECTKVQNYIQNACADMTRIVTLAICLPKSHQSIAAALYLPSSVFKDALQILTYQRLSGTIINKVAQPENPTYRYMKLRPFGMIDEGYSPKVDDDRLARMFAYVYDSYYINKDKGIPNTWDVSLTSYFDAAAPYNQAWGGKKVFERISSQFCANTLGTKLRSIGIDLSPSSSTPTDFKTIEDRVKDEMAFLQQVEHNRWNIEKLLTGFRALTEKESSRLRMLKAAWGHLEQKEKSEAYTEWIKYRKQLKEWPERAHLDLCPFHLLQQVEEEVILTHDKKLCEAIPYIVRSMKVLDS